MLDCIKCQKKFKVRDKDREFYKRFDAPDPEMCPDCRLQHRLCFRNERTLYKRTSSLSNKPMISIYDTDAPYPIYSADEWWADTWTGLDYGVDFDFNRPFFEQFKELQLKVPRIGLFNVNATNSDYCQQAYNNKNSYLCTVVEECDECMYVTHSNKMVNCYDCSFLQHSELCYESIDSAQLYGCIGCQSCTNSSSLLFCYDCIGCKDCVGCIGLRNKQYYIMNKKFSQEDYENEIKKLDMGKYSKYLNAKKYFLGWIKSLPHRSNRNFNVEDCTGNYLINGQRCHECFDSFEIQDCAYCTWIFNSHDCQDVYGMGYSEWVLQGLGVEKLNNCAFNTFVSDSSDAFYSDLSFYCMDIFGCVGLRNKKYCIFNKQYEEAQYKDLKGRIIEHMKKTGEWGKFFPIELSPYKYNETAANNLFPLSKEKSLSEGFSWKDDIVKEYKDQSVEMADDVAEIDEGIVNETLACTKCRKNFKVQPNELQYYKKMTLPVPRECPDCRYAERMSWRNPRKMYDRRCGKCSAEIRTTYSPDRPEKILCEKCYADEVK